MKQPWLLRRGRCARPRGLPTRGLAPADSRATVAAEVSNCRRESIRQSRSGREISSQEMRTSSHLAWSPSRSKGYAPFLRRITCSTVSATLFFNPRSVASADFGSLRSSRSARNQSSTAWPSWPPVRGTDHRESPAAAEDRLPASLPPLGPADRELPRRIPDGLRGSRVSGGASCMTSGERRSAISSAPVFQRARGHEIERPRDPQRVRSL